MHLHSHHAATLRLRLLIIEMAKSFFSCWQKSCCNSAKNKCNCSPDFCPFRFYFLIVLLGLYWNNNIAKCIDSIAHSGCSGIGSKDTFDCLQHFALHAVDRYFRVQLSMRSFERNIVFMFSNQLSAMVFYECLKASNYILINHKELLCEDKWKWIEMSLRHVSCSVVI